MNDVITAEKIERYLDITKRAIEKIKVVTPDRSFSKRMADDFLTMVNAYYSDAKYYKEQGDYVTAFASVNYAHGWLDCGARIGLWDVGGDDQLFTLYE